MDKFKSMILRSGYYISTDPAKLDRPLIHCFLSERSHWAKGRTLETVDKSIRHSLCFGLYDAAHCQVGFARIITDFTDYAYIMDVFVLELYRGKGLGKFLMESIINYPDLQEIKKWALTTSTAHGLYEQFGFAIVSHPEKLMERSV